MGHIHEHEELEFEGRRWDIVGSPQFQVHDMKRLPEDRKQHGYYILGDDNAETFHQCVSAPKFVTVYASDFVKGKVDESMLKGSIIRRCYDIVLNDEQKTKLDGLVSGAGVYEEDSSVFVLGVSEDGSSESQEQQAEDMGIVADKFDYIQRQIDKIEHPSIDNAKLSKMLREYYERAMV